MSKHIIELNGKRYDAITGALLGANEGASVAKVAAKRAAHAAHPPRVIDGIVGPKKASGGKPSFLKPQPASVSTARAAKKPAASRATGKPLTPHQPERPKTLMRSVVKKPNVTKKPAIKTQTPAEVMAKPDGTLVPKRSVNQVDPGRLARAKHTAKSQLVKRFDVAPAANVPRPVPAARGQHAASARPNQYANPVTRTGTIRPAAAPKAQPQPQKKHTDIFEAALEHATSHEQAAPKPHRKKSHRWANITAGVVAFLIMGGFITYLNIPNIEVHVASVRAGFSAQLPGYKPVGYALGDIKTQDGQVNISFRSGDQKFTITQQASDWNSQTLLDNDIALSSHAHQSIQSKGRTIYLYDNNRAAWVNAGIRYDITGNAVLSPSDVAAIASSM